MPTSNDDAKLLETLAMEIRRDRADRTQLLEKIQGLLDKLHDLANNILVNAAAENRLAGVAERQLGIIGAQAKSIQDIPEIVETQGYSVVADMRVLWSDMRAELQAHLNLDDKRMEEIRRMFVAIERSAAVAANDAGDAKNAANAVREAAGQQHKPERSSGTPASVASVAREFLRDLPTWAKLFIAVLALIGTLFGGQAIEARWKLLGGGRGEHHQKGEKSEP